MLLYRLLESGLPLMVGYRLDCGMGEDHVCHAAVVVGMNQQGRVLIHDPHTHFCATEGKWKKNQAGVSTVPFSRFFESWVDASEDLDAFHFHHRTISEEESEVRGMWMQIGRPEDVNLVMPSSPPAMENPLPPPPPSVSLSVSGMASSTPPPSGAVSPAPANPKDEYSSLGSDAPAIPAPAPTLQPQPSSNPRMPATHAKMCPRSPNSPGSSGHAAMPPMPPASAAAATATTAGLWEAIFPDEYDAV